MKEKLSGVLEKVKAFFGKISKKTRVLLGAVLGIALVAIIAVLVAQSLKPYEVLFAGLTSSDTANIVRYLEENGVTDYKIENNDTILVPKSQEAQLKAQLLMANYPSSGFAYSTYFDNIGSLATESDRKTALMFDLQDRLAAVVRCFDGVKDATVGIATGEDRRYVLDSSNVVSATAYVFVTMESGATLSDEQAAAIRNLVSRAVQGLEIEDVAISDAKGNVYPGGAGGGADTSDLKLRLEAQVSNKVRTEILQILTPLYGEDNVWVAVNSVVDVSHKVSESTEYTSPEGAPEGTGIIGSKVYDQEIVRGGTETAGGVVGATPNSNLPSYVQTEMQADGTENYIKNQGEDNYLVNSSTEQKDSLAAGTVTDLMVAVTLNSDVASGANTDSLTTHIARAAGIGAEVEGEKISILIGSFYKPPVVDIPIPGINLPTWAIYAAIGGAALFLILLILILILRGKSKKKKRKNMMAAGVPMAAAVMVPEPQGADIMEIQTEKSMELRKGIRQFADENPEIAAQMVKSWLRGGEDSNG